MIANHLWQSTAFAAAAALLTLVLRGNHARTRHWVWTAASLKFLMPFAMLAALGSVAGSRTAVRPVAGVRLAAQVEVMASPMEWAASPSLPVRADPWPDIAFAIWAAGTLVLSARWWMRWRRLRAVVRAARPVEIAFPIPVRTSSGAMEPGVFGIFRSVLLLPEGIAKRLTPAQLRAILAHELCHVRRRDNLWAAAHMLVEALFWFHPLVWWVGARLVEERERPCDEEVVAAGGEPEAYAEGILAACKLYLESPLACVAGVGGGDLRKRIERIMGEWAPRELSAAGKALIGAAAALALAMPMAVGFLHAPVARAQGDQMAGPKFEVASVKPARPDAEERQLAFRPGARLSASNATVKQLVLAAYEIMPFQLSGAPDWVESEGFDVEAKPADPKTTRERFREMIQALLADRFHLRFHRATKSLPIYELVVAKGGPRLEGARNDDPEVDMRSSRGRMTGIRATMPMFASALSRPLERKVVDETGLKGVYTFELKFVPDEGSGRPAPPERSGPPRPDDSEPSIFTALREQLGLSLKPTRGPVDILVIDHVERPSEN